VCVCVCVVSEKNNNTFATTACGYYGSTPANIALVVHAPNARNTDDNNIKRTQH